MTTVLMVSGSWPPAACRVGHYAELLCQNLETAGLNVVRYGHPMLSPLRARRMLDEIASLACDLVHIQYPTAGYGRSHVPGAIARHMRSKPVVVTLHEYPVSRFYRKPWLAPFARHCATRVFTASFDRALFEWWFPERDGFDATIEVASAIPKGAPARRRTNKVVFLGGIAPDSGVEQFLALHEMLRARAAGIAAALIGAIPLQQRRYAEMMLARARAAGAEIACDLPPESVADHLAQARFAYLPFPDGASGKHGALAAALINGLVVITRHSALTPDWLRAATISARSPAEACHALVALERDDAGRKRLVQRAALTAKRFCWDSVTARHVELYRSLLGLTDEMPASRATA